MTDRVHESLAAFLFPVRAESARVIEALTHRSFLAENRLRDGADNQRLEFLGDAVLQWMSSAYLFQKYPGEEEGQLTKRRSQIVSREALCDLARRIGLPESLRLGRGEERDGGRLRPNTLADAMEAVIGAVYLELGPAECEGWVRRVLHPFWEERLRSTKLSNPKGELQEILQNLGTDVPVYSVVESSGPDHARHFRVVVTWRDCELGYGEGSSKKEAETAAAARALASRLWEGAAK